MPKLQIKNGVNRPLIDGVNYNSYDVYCNDVYVVSMFGPMAVMTAGLICHNMSGSTIPFDMKPTDILKEYMWKYED